MTFIADTIGRYSNHRATTAFADSETRTEVRIQFSAVRQPLLRQGHPAKSVCDSYFIDPTAERACPRLYFTAV